MEQRLYEAALEGSVKSLHELLGEDPLILDIVAVNCSDRTPLHVAAIRGHVDFVKEILAQNPELAGELDSQGSCPLHWASAKGHVEIVKALLSANPDMCHARNQDGRNPLHLAAIKGRVDVLKELIQVKPDAARSIVPDRKSGTILHLCVQHNGLEALKLLLETMNDHEFVNSKDGDDNTILDLAIANKKIETIKYLLQSGAQIDVNATNANSLTAIRARYLHTSLISSGNENGRSTSQPLICLLFPSSFRNQLIDYDSWSEHMKEIRTGIMVAASVVLQLTFQIGVNPPGGFWQDDSAGHKAGHAVMPDNSPDLYAFFYYSNLGSFVSSVVVMLFLCVPIPLKKSSLEAVIFSCLLSTVFLVGTTYAVSIRAIIERPPSFSSRGVKVTLTIAIIIYFLFVILIAPLRKRRVSPNSSSGDANRDQRRSSEC